MSITDHVTNYDTMIRNDISRACGQPVEAGLLVVPNPERLSPASPRGGPVSLDSGLAALNYLALTPTHLRLYTLGGPTGVETKAIAAVWNRWEVTLNVEAAVRFSCFGCRSEGQPHAVHAISISTPDAEVAIDVIAGEIDDTSDGHSSADEILHELELVLSGTVVDVSQDVERLLSDLRSSVEVTEETTGDQTPPEAVRTAELVSVRP